MVTRSVSDIFKALWIFSLYDIAACATCSYYDYGGGTTYMSCQYGCCGTYYARACCSGPSSAPVLFDFSGIISGAVVGGIVLIVCIVTSILYYKKRYHRRTVVVAPSRNKTVTVNTSTTASTRTSSTVSTVQPPPYVAHGPYPPTPQPGPSSYPAYPPPPMAYPSYPPPPPYPTNTNPWGL